MQTTQQSVENLNVRVKLASENGHREHFISNVLPREMAALQARKPNEEVSNRIAAYRQVIAANT